MWGDTHGRPQPASATLMTTARTLTRNLTSDKLRLFLEQEPNLSSLAPLLGDGVDSNLLIETASLKDNLVVTDGNTLLAPEEVEAILPPTRLVRNVLLQVPRPALRPFVAPRLRLQAPGLPHLCGCHHRWLLTQVRAAAGATATLRRRSLRPPPADPRSRRDVGRAARSSWASTWARASGTSFAALYARKLTRWTELHRRSCRCKTARTWSCNMSADSVRRSPASRGHTRPSRHAAVASSTRSCGAPRRRSRAP